MLLQFYILSTIFIVWYAWNRSMHDSHLFGSSDYRWHWWALQEAIVLNSLLIIGLYVYQEAIATISIQRFKFIALWFSNALLFWIIFDMLMGYHAVRDIWYIGITGIDKHIRKIFLYDRIKGKGYFIFKLILYLIFTCGLYFEIGIDSLFK